MSANYCALCHCWGGHLDTCSAGVSMTRSVPDPSLSEFLLSPSSTPLRVATHYAQKREEAEAAIERVKAIHYIRQCGCDARACNEAVCADCFEPWPCATIRALEGT